MTRRPPCSKPCSPRRSTRSWRCRTPTAPTRATEEARSRRRRLQGFEGRTPMMRAVKEAERRLLEAQATKAYLGPAGDEGFNAAMVGWCSARTRRPSRIAAASRAPGGTGAPAACFRPGRPRRARRRRLAVGADLAQPSADRRSPPGWNSAPIPISTRPPARSTGRRCAPRWPRPGPATWWCCMAAATTPPGPTSPSSNGASLPIWRSTAASCRSSTWPIRVSATGWKPTPRACA
jgi:hypothetical protein